MILPGTDGEEQKQLHIWHGPQRIDRNCPDKERQEERPKLNVAAGQGWGRRAMLLFMCAPESQAQVVLRS